MCSPGTGSDRAGAGSFPGHRDGVAGQACAGRAQSVCQQARKASFRGQVAAELEDALPGVAGQAGGQAQELAGRSVSGSASLRPPQSYRPSSRHQAARSAAMSAASTQPRFTAQVFNIWQVAQAHGLAGVHLVLHDGVLAVQHVDELDVVAPRHAGYPADGRDVGDDDGVPPAGGALERGQVPALPPRRLGAPHDPPQPAGPSGGPAEQVGDFGDVLVFLRGTVVVHRGVPGGGPHRPCGPGPTLATGLPPIGWPVCRPSTATSTSCAPGSTSATGPPTGGWLRF